MKIQYDVEKVFLANVSVACILYADSFPMYSAFDAFLRVRRSKDKNLKATTINGNTF